MSTDARENGQTQPTGSPEWLLTSTISALNDINRSLGRLEMQSEASQRTLISHIAALANHAVFLSNRLEDHARDATGRMMRLEQVHVPALQRQMATLTSTTSATASPSTTPATGRGTLHKLMHKVSGEAIMEACRWLVHRLGTFLLRKVLPSALAAAFAAASGLGSMLTKWLGLLWRMAGW